MSEIEEFVHQWVDAHNGDLNAAIQGLATAYQAAEQEAEALRLKLSRGYTRDLLKAI